MHGLLMGLARMAQGGHWPSDILWSAGCIWLCAWGLNWLLSRRWVEDSEPGVGTLPAARRT
jgi:membrane-associated phospholipid phosphatase